MLASAEQGVKQVLLEELGTLSYAEKRKVRDALDPKYIDAELKNLEKKKRYPIMYGLFQLILVVQAFSLFFFGRAPQSRILFFIQIAAGLVGAFMAGREFGKWEKRRLVYRVFSRLAALSKSHDVGVTN